MAQCENCNGCSGCGNNCQLSLTKPELDMLLTLGQFPFLPVARKADDMTPFYLEEQNYAPEDYSIVLQLLEKKGLISIDYDAPLKRMDMSAYHGYPVHGSFALTERGQTVLQILESKNKPRPQPSVGGIYYGTITIVLPALSVPSAATAVTRRVIRLPLVEAAA